MVGHRLARPQKQIGARGDGRHIHIGSDIGLVDGIYDRIINSFSFILALLFLNLFSIYHTENEEIGSNKSQNATIEINSTTCVGLFFTSVRYSKPPTPGLPSRCKFISVITQPIEVGDVV